MDFINAIQADLPSTPYQNGIFSLINKADFLRFITIKRSLSENSIRNCMLRFEVIKKWMIENDRDFDKWGIEALIAYLKYVKKLHDNTISSFFFALYNIELYCLDRGLMNESILDSFKRPRKIQPHIRVLSIDEIEALINVKRTYANRNGVNNDELEFFYTTLITFLALTGCRVSEAFNLKVSNLDFGAEKAIFEMTKTRRSREIYFTDPLKSRLIKLVEGKNSYEYVFSYKNNKKLIQQTLAAELKKRAKIAKIDKRVYPHLFRHSFATQLLISGVELTYVSSLVGHSRIETTYQTYIHLADTKRRQAQFMHPLIRKSQNLTSIINSVRTNILNFRFDNDKRFNYEIKEKNGKFTFKLEPKMLENTSENSNELK